MAKLFVFRKVIYPLLIVSLWEAQIMLLDAFDLNWLIYPKTDSVDLGIDGGIWMPNSETGGIIQGAGGRESGASLLCRGVGR